MVRARIGSLSATSSPLSGTQVAITERMSRATGRYVMTLSTAPLPGTLKGRLVSGSDARRLKNAGNMGT